MNPQIWNMDLDIFILTLIFKIIFNINRKLKNEPMCPNSQLLANISALFIPPLHQIIVKSNISSPQPSRHQIVIVSCHRFANFVVFMFINRHLFSCVTGFDRRLSTFMNHDRVLVVVCPPS